MKHVASGQFRRTYATLDEPTIVTVNGHPIGVWSPAMHPFPGLAVEDVERIAQPFGNDKTGEVFTVDRHMTQAERDAILRRVNKG